MQCADQWRTEDFIIGVSSYGPKGRAAETRKAESEDVVFGEGQPAPRHQL